MSLNNSRSVKPRIVKVDGRVEEFDEEKVYRSCVAAGAPEGVAREISKEIASIVKDGMTTTEIRRMVLSKLRDRAPEAADAWEFYDRIVKGRITFENGKFVVVEKGRLYLGREVKDMGKPGLSSAEEVRGILRELEEDLEHGVSRRTINARTFALFMGVLKSRKMPREEKLKSIELINEFRVKLGWKPYKLKRPLE